MAVEIAEGHGVPAGVGSGAGVAERPVVVVLPRRTVVVGLGLTAAGAVLLPAAVRSATAVRFGGRAVATGFGVAEVLRAERQSRLPGGPGDGAGHAAHGRPGGAGGEGPQPVNHTFGDAVGLLVAVRNDLGERVPFSPGQLRLRVGPQALAVTAWDTDTAAGVLGAGAALEFRITFLAPSGEAAATAVLDDPFGEPVVLPLPPVTHRGGALEARHG